MNRVRHFVGLGALGVLLAMTLLVLKPAYASTSAVLVVGNYLDSLNADKTSAAVALFADDAVLAIPARGECYLGQQAISQYMQTMAHPGRQYDIVSLTSNGNTVDGAVDIYDHGVRWAQETIRFEVDGRSLRSMTISAIRLTV